MLIKLENGELHSTDSEAIVLVISLDEIKNLVNMLPNNRYCSFPRKVTEEEVREFMRLPDDKEEDKSPLKSLGGSSFLPEKNSEPTIVPR